MAIDLEENLEVFRISGPFVPNIFFPFLSSDAVLWFVYLEDGIGITWGVQGGQMPLQYFFYLRMQFLATEWKRSNLKNRNNIFKRLFGWCKDRKNEKLALKRIFPIFLT
jgi:hypothetical protein